MERPYLYQSKATKRRAYSEYGRALKEGRLVRPDACSRCGGDGDGKAIEGHHHDYTKPLDVEWLCRSCHRLAHTGDHRPPVLGPTMEPGYIRQKDAAALLNVSGPTVLAMERRGDLRGFRPTGTLVRYRLAEVRELVARRAEVA